MTSATESAVKVTILPKAKRKRRKYTLRIQIRYERKQKCSFRDHLPQQKRKMTVIHAKNLEKVPVTTSAKQGAVFESILPQQKKKETTIIHAKNSEKVRAQTKVQFYRPFHPCKKGRRR